MSGEFVLYGEGGAPVGTWDQIEDINRAILLEENRILLKKKNTKPHKSYMLNKAHAPKKESPVASKELYNLYKKLGKVWDPVIQQRRFFHEQIELKNKK